MEIREEIQIYQIILKKMKEALENDIKPLLADKSIPLEERWELFAAAEELMPIRSFHISEIMVDEYDLFDTNRGSIVLFLERYDWLKEAHEGFEEDEDDYYQSVVETYPDLDAWRELVLASGYRGAVYDW